MEQRSEAWFQARCGSLGASSLAEAMAKTKTGWGAGRANVMARLIAERLTGVPQESFVSAAMQHGIDTEAEARAAYEFYCDQTVTEVGIIYHPGITGTHASPDGLAGESGLVEIKCPNTATHLDYLLTGSIPDKYVVQMLWQMACTGREWCDFASYDPRLPEEMRLFVKRFYRDSDRIMELEGQVIAFLTELDDKVQRLREKFGIAQPPAEASSGEKSKEKSNPDTAAPTPPAEKAEEKAKQVAEKSKTVTDGEIDKAGFDAFCKGVPRAKVEELYRYVKQQKLWLSGWDKARELAASAEAAA